MGIYLRKGLIAILILLIIGCSSGGEGGGDDEIVGTGGLPEEIAGVAQKGPFVTNSNVTVNLLADTGQATTDTILTFTDDLGNFTFELDNPSLVQISVEGYHFNEITGAISNGPITLNATFDTSESTFVVVNVLTHLINNRVRFLIAQGSSASDAITQAQTELITALNGVLVVTALPDFTQLSVYNLNGTNPIGNAYLLALSATLYNFASIEVGGDSGLLSGKLTEVVNTLATDLETDGVIDNTAVIAGMKSATTSLNPDDIEANLISRSVEVLGEALEVPDINLFIDTDQDGIVNSNDNDDDGDGIEDSVDPEPYVYNNIPTVESFSISANGGAAVLYNEVVDDTSVSGYVTNIAARIDETRTPGGVITPTPTIHLSHNEGDGTFRLLNMYLPAEAPGTYYIDDVTRVRYFRYSEDMLYFDYRPESGSITITEYGGIGNAVIGSYDVTLSCRIEALECIPGDLLRINGEFTLIRDEPQHFISVGTATSPVDLGGFPFEILWWKHFNGSSFDGYNMNIVSSTGPSYYQFSVNPSNQYTIELPWQIGGVQLSVYTTPDLTTPVCESFVSPISCTVTPVSDTLYFTVSLLNPTALGAWYSMDITPASFVDEGTAANPLDISDQRNYIGQVGLTGSYYRFDVTPGSMYHFSYQGWGSATFDVATDNAFNNVLCGRYVNTQNDRCNVAIDTSITELFLRVELSPNSTIPPRDGIFFEFEHWEITTPIYQVQVFPTPVPTTGETMANAGVEFYELDGTIVSGMHVPEYTNSSVLSFSGNIPLVPGRTYRVKLEDRLYYNIGVGKPDYYAVWLGSAGFTGALESIMPDTSLNEPANNYSSGAVPMIFESLYYSSFLIDENDIDWFEVTIPNTGP